MQHSTASPLAGQMVKLNLAHPFHNGDTLEPVVVVEDWWDRVSGGSWMTSVGNPAALGYAVRGAIGRLPLDDDVIYAKDDTGVGHLVHASEVAPS